ncbi:MAG TPA: hypothetical protein PKI61_01245 [bacterium]|nr:hypothetical protein [bacterium]HPT29703.1 hypothetical protein [bacterium]
MDTPITTHYTSEHPELILESWELARRELKKFLNWVLSNSGELGLDRDRKLSRHFINSVFDALKDGGYKDVLGSAIVA